VTKKKRLYFVVEVLEYTYGPLTVHMLSRPAKAYPTPRPRYVRRMHVMWDRKFGEALRIVDVSRRYRPDWR
jgi:hypothetical protein